MSSPIIIQEKKDECNRIINNISEKLRPILAALLGLESLNSSDFNTTGKFDMGCNSCTVKRVIILTWVLSNIKKYTYICPVTLSDISIFFSVGLVWLVYWWSLVWSVG